MGKVQVELSQPYKGRKARDTISVSETEAAALETLGLGKVVPEEEPVAQEPGETREAE